VARHQSWQADQTRPGTRTTGLDHGLRTRADKEPAGRAGAIALVTLENWVDSSLESLAEGGNRTQRLP
jgi:hypothetical protein